MLYEEMIFDKGSNIGSNIVRVYKIFEGKALIFDPFYEPNGDGWKMVNLSQLILIGKNNTAYRG